MTVASQDAAVRAALSSSAAAFLALVARLTPAQLELPGTDAWSVRELVAHAARAFLATETVLDAPVDDTTPWLDSAAAYYRAAFAITGVHEGIVERGRAASVAMGDDPAGFVEDASARVLARIAATPGDRTVQHFGGRLRLDDYLMTRVTELVLHTVDAQLAIGEAPAAPEDAARVVADLLLELTDRADPLVLACALAGRRLPDALDVLR